MITWTFGVFWPRTTETSLCCYSTRAECAQHKHIYASMGYKVSKVAMLANYWR